MAKFREFQPGFRLINGDDLIRMVQYLFSVSYSLVATGTTAATALQLTASYSQFTTVAASTGCMLQPGNPGVFQRIFNGGANNLTVYASTTVAADALAADQLNDHAAQAGTLVTSVVIAPGYEAVFTCYEPGFIKMLVSA